MKQLFVDRKEELEFLERKYEEKLPNLIILYGRRRVGKTEIIKQFIKNKKSIYILASKESIKENIKSIKQKFFELTKKEYFLKIETDSFFDLFKFFVEEVKKEKIIVVVDEFPYLIELNKGMVSTFQKIWDELLINTKMMMILCGSSVGMMETEVLDYKSPLYGRRTGEWKVTPLRLRYLRDFFKNYSLEDIIKVYSICDTIPLYLSKLDSKLSVEENIKQKILRKGEVLYNEPFVLLREEFREPRIYMLILKYISLGYSSLGKLCSVTGLDKGNLSKYLSTLENTHIIKHVLPLFKRKKGIYEISDMFFNFWFRFVYPNISDLELGNIEDVFERMKKNINSYFGYGFERFVFKLFKEKELNFPFTLLGKQFGIIPEKKESYEIDLIALNEQTKEILFAECKWKSKVNALKVVEELAEKSNYVDWNREKRRESFAVFAKSFSKRIGEFEGKKVYCFDLKDLGKIFKY